MDYIKISKDSLIFLLIALYLCAIFVYFGYKYLRIRDVLINFCRSLGAYHIRDSFPVWPVHVLDHMGRSYEIYLGGAQYAKLYDLNFQTIIHTKGFLRIWKPDFLERFFFKNVKGSLSAKYDDKDWAFQIIEDQLLWGKIETLFNEYNIEFIEINGNRLTIGWHLGKFSKLEDSLNERLKKNNIISALDVLNVLSKHLDMIKPSKTYYEDLRKLLGFNIPIFFAILLSLLGLYFDPFKYQPLCELELIYKGYKIMLPMIFVYSMTITILSAKGNLASWYFMKAFLTCLFCACPVILFFVPYVNGKFDKSEPVTYVDKIVNKYKVLPKGRFKITLEKHKRCDFWDASFKVSERFFNNASIGDTVEFKVKNGYLGIKWYFEKLILKKEKEL